MIVVIDQQVSHLYRWCDLFAYGILAQSSLSEISLRDYFDCF